MSREFMTAIIAILVAFCAFEVSLNYALRGVNDRLQSACSKPSAAVYAMSAADVRRPMRRGTMRR
jgi:hypothetical protein